MAIRGLTDKGGMLPELGQLRKGAPKETKTKMKDGKQVEYQTYGQELEYFRFDTADLDAKKKFKAAYGDEPKEINVYLPFATLDENFDAWKEEWDASGLRHRCDGERTVIWQDQKGIYHSLPEEQKDCPYRKLPHSEQKCKATGRLKVIIPALDRLAYVTAGTTSIHDVMNIHANLLALQNGVGTLRGVPLVLKRVKREISTPSGTAGKRLRRTKWLLSIEAEKQWAALMLESYKEQAKAALIGAVNQLQLPAAPPEFDVEAEEIDDSAERARLKEEFRKLWPKTKSADDFDGYFDLKFAEVPIEDIEEQLKAARELAAKIAEAARLKHEAEAIGQPIDNEVLEAEPVIDAEVAASLSDLDQVKASLAATGMTPLEVAEEVARLLPDDVAELADCTYRQIDEITEGLQLRLQQRIKAA